MSYETRLRSGEELFLVKEDVVICKITAATKSTICIDADSSIKIVLAADLTRKQYDSYLKGTSPYGDAIRSRTQPPKTKKQGS